LLGRDLSEEPERDRCSSDGVRSTGAVDRVADDPESRSQARETVMLSRDGGGHRDHDVGWMPCDATVPDGGDREARAASSFAGRAAPFDEGGTLAEQPVVVQRVDMGDAEPRR